MKLIKNKWSAAGEISKCLAIALGIVGLCAAVITLFGIAKFAICLGTCFTTIIIAFLVAFVREEILK